MWPDQISSLPTCSKLTRLHADQLRERAAGRERGGEEEAVLVERAAHRARRQAARAIAVDVDRRLDRPRARRRARHRAPADPVHFAEQRAPGGTGSVTGFSSSSSTVRV